MSAAIKLANCPDPLDCKLSIIPLTEDVRGAITKSLWGETSDGQFYTSAVKDLDTYFSYWGDECRVARTTSRCHRDVLNVVERLKQPDGTRDSIKEGIDQDDSDAISNYEELVDASVALAVRLWLMVYIDSVGLSQTVGHTQARWEQGTFQDFVAGVFSPDHGLHSNVKLERLFNARNLERIAGVRVTWTSNLADHLSMRDDDTRVLVFHHVTFLECHQSSSCSAFPVDFLDETLRSISLLLPPGDAKLEKWFKVKQKKVHLDPKVLSCPYLKQADRQIENFRYWRDRLVVLKQTFDESEPKTVRAWWSDDRKRVQWYTFWVAALVLALTVFFGLIQSTTALIQAWASVTSLNEDRRHGG